LDQSRKPPVASGKAIIAPIPGKEKTGHEDHAPASKAGPIHTSNANAAAQDHPQPLLAGGRIRRAATLEILLVRIGGGRSDGREKAKRKSNEHREGGNLLHGST
jgi:hypothetical protein